MRIEWTPDLSVGVVEVDTQHQELFNRINALMEACSQGKGREHVTQIINFLGEYTITHFSTEEKLMAAHNYPEFDEHKKLHDLFIESFMNLKKKLEDEGPGGHIVIETNRVVVTWLNGHIRNVDKKLGAFLNSKSL